MNIHTALLALSCLAVSPAWAINKCTLPDGTVALQDLPCAGPAKAEAVRTYTGQGAAQQQDARTQKAAALCEAMWRNAPNWKDPESVRISNVRRTGFTTIKLHDTSIMAVGYTAEVNAKNSYGGYVGRKPALCYLDQTESRVLDVVTFN